jgi:adenylylsulfate kinase-like enzyme
VSDPYEPPEAAEVECLTEWETVEESAEKVLGAIWERLKGERRGKREEGRENG